VELRYKTNIRKSHPELIFPIRKWQSSDGSFEEEASPSAAEKAYWMIRENIITLAYPPGSSIRDTDLSKTIGFGRTPIREALKRLEVEQLVSSHYRKGTYINEIRLVDIKRQYQVRRQLLTLAVALVSQSEDKSLPQLVNKVHSLTHGSKEYSIQRIFLQVTELQLAFAGTAGNPYLFQTLRRYCGYARRTWHLLKSNLSVEDLQLEDYAKILDRVLEGDGEESSQLMAFHVDQVHLKTVDRFLEIFI